MSDYNLGTAHGTIQIDYNGSGVNQATQGLGQVSQQATSSHEAVKKVGTGFTVAGASIAAGLGVAIKSAADFEKGLSGIQAVSGASQGEMETVRKKALQLGQDTAFSASEASTAIEELVKAGVSIPDVMNGAADATVALAAAGGVALPEAATIASNAMNQFGLKAKDLPGITDAIAGAANASAIDVSELGQSMQQVGAVANLAGFSFKDTAVAIAEMGNAGIKGSDAGTSLKTMFQNLIPQTDAQRSEMEKLGLVTVGGQTAMEKLAQRGIKPLSNNLADVQKAIADYVKKTTGLSASSAAGKKAIADLGNQTGAIQNQFFDATGKVKSMADIQGVLAKAYKGSTKEQMLASQGMLFGSDAIRASAVLTKSGADGYDKMAAAMGKVSAADVAATRMKNLSGQVEQLKGSAETFAIQIGTILIPALTGIVKNVTGVVNWFSQLDSGTQKAIAITAAFVAGVLLFIGALVKTVQAVQAVKAAMLALNGTFLANPIFLIIVAIVALIAGLVLLYKNNEKFRNFVNKAWASIKSAISAVADWVTGTLVPALVGAWNAVSGAAVSLWHSLTSAWSSIRSGVSSAWNAIVGVFTTVWTTIVTVVTTYIGMVRTAISTGVNAVLAVWNAVWGLFGPLVMAVWNLITAIIQVALAWIMVFIRAQLSMLQAAWSAVWNAIVAVFSAVWGAIRAVVSTVWGWIVAFIRAEVNGVRAVISAGFNAARAVVSAVMNAIRAVISAVWGVIGGTVMGAVNRIKSVVSSAFNAAKNAASSAFSALKSAVTSHINGAHQAVSSAVSAIKGVFSGAGGWLVDSGKRLIQGLIDGITSMVGKAADAINGVADKIRGFLPGSPIREGSLKQHGWNEGRPGKMLVGMVTDGIDRDISKINSAFAGIDPQLPSSLTSPELAVSASSARTAASSAADASMSSGSSMQLVSGSLAIDASGRAWIQGVAQQVVDGSNNYQGTLTRMGANN